MKQHQEILEFYNANKSSNEQFAHALLFHVSGSTYRKTGARMLISVNGEYCGGISGGCLESDVQQKAKLNLLLNRSEIITYNTSKEKSGPGANLGCDGTIEILVHPLNSDNPFNAVKALSKIAGQRTPQVLITVVRAYADTFQSKIGNVYSVNDFKTAEPDFETEIINVSELVISAKNSHLFQLKKQDELVAELFVEFVQPMIRLVVAGDHKDVLPLIGMSQILGWEIVVIGRKERYPKQVQDTLTIIDNSELENIAIDDYTAVVFMSHNFEADVINLPKVIHRNAFYVGILGPEKRKNRLLTTLNLTDLHSQIAGPIGLRIGSKSPEEIALAVCAEIQQEFARKFDFRNQSHVQQSINPNETIYHSF